MRKNIFSLLFLALIATAFITSCGKDDSCVECPSTSAEREALYVGSYTGTVTVNLGAIPVSVPATFVVTNPVSGDDSITLTSPQLYSSTYQIKAKISSTDCKSVTVVPIIVDSLPFTNLPSSLNAFTPLSILDLSTTGTGTLSCDGKSLGVNISISAGTVSSPNALANGQTVAGSTLQVSLKK
jgi:hypothetical protein